MGPQPSAGMEALHGPQEQTARVTAASLPLRAPRSAPGLASLLASDLLRLLGNGRDAHAAFRDGALGCAESKSGVWGVPRVGLGEGGAVGQDDLAPGHGPHGEVHISWSEMGIRTDGRLPGLSVPAGQGHRTLVTAMSADRHQDVSTLGVLALSQNVWCTVCNRAG